RLLGARLAAGPVEKVALARRQIKRTAGQIEERIDNQTVVFRHVPAAARREISIPVAAKIVAITRAFVQVVVKDKRPAVELSDESKAAFDADDLPRRGEEFVIPPAARQDFHPAAIGLPGMEHAS